MIVDKLLLNVKDATGSAGKGYIEVQKPAARLLGAILRRWWAEAEASGNPDAHPTAQPRCGLEMKLTKVLTRGATVGFHQAGTGVRHAASKPGCGPFPSTSAAPPPRPPPSEEDAAGPVK